MSIRRLTPPQPRSGITAAPARADQGRDVGGHATRRRLD
jgi:hypothetical protein